MNVPFAFIPMVIAAARIPVSIFVMAGLLVAAAVLFAGALVLLYRRGMSRKQMFLLIGSIMGSVFLFTLFGILGVPSREIGLLPIGIVLLSNALRRRSQGRCGKSGHPQNQ